MKWADLLEAVFALVMLAGLAIMWWPVALLVGGLLGVLACERRSAMASDAKRSVAVKARYDEVQAALTELKTRSNGVTPGPGRMV